jgi:hypothetical protein
MPNDLLTSDGCLTGSKPFTDIVPELGWRSVVSILIVVVLPAPFGPKNAKVEPLGTSKLTSFTATNVSLKVLDKFETVMVWSLGEVDMEGYYSIVKNGNVDN